MTTLTVGPAQGSLLLHTTSEGRAGRIGHDLTIEVSDWTAELEAEGARLTALTMTAAVASLTVLKGTGGLKPLSDGDRKTIAENAAKTLQAEWFPAITFRLAEAAEIAAETTVIGELTIAGRSRPTTVVVTTAPADGGTRATAAVPVRQTEFGVKPYSAMLGQLRVADLVTVSLDVTVPAAP